MKKLLLTLFTLALSASIHAQDFERYSYYLVSDSIYESKDYTYLERDTVDAYGIIPLTGEDQFVQITDKPVFVARYDEKLDTLIYLYAYSAVYNIDQATGEPHYWMGNWNPLEYSKNNNLGWDKAKDKSFPYMYLWWTFENYSAPEEYYIFRIDPGMYNVLLDKESMVDDDPIIMFAKMDDLKPIPNTPDYPRIDFYKYTKHTYNPGGYSSSYGAINNFWSALYYINHGSSSGSTTKTYYTWDIYKKWDHPHKSSSNNLLKDYYYVYDANVNNDLLTCVFYFADSKEPYGVKKGEYDSLLETNWYDLVPYENEKNWLNLEDRGGDVLLWDIENKRVALISKELYHELTEDYDYDSYMYYFDWYYVNFVVEGNEGLPFSALDVHNMINKYEKYTQDSEGAQKMRDYALNKEASYKLVYMIVDELYLHYGTVITGVPQFTEDQVKEFIDAYQTVFNDPVGAKKLREYAFGTDGINYISADNKATTIYDLSGRRINAPSKGIYIRNGKKIVR